MAVGMGIVLGWDRIGPLSCLWLLLAVACSDPSDKDTQNTAGTAGSSAGATAMGGSGGSVAGQPSGGGGVSGSGGSSGSSAGPACNALALDAPAIDFTYDAGKAPEPTGGAVADGTYFLSAEIAYEAPPLGTVSFGRTQIEIAGDVWQEVRGDAEDDSVNPIRHTTNTFSVSGTTLTLERTCPSANDPESAGYTATETSLTLYVNDRGKVFGTVFTKQ